MLADLDQPGSVNFRPLTVEEAAKLAVDCISAVGHADTAAVFSSDLGVMVPANRTTIALRKGDKLLVGQYRGPRLPEGAKDLPEGSTIEWVLVSIN